MVKFQILAILTISVLGSASYFFYSGYAQSSTPPGLITTPPGAGGLVTNQPGLITNPPGAGGLVTNQPGLITNPPGAGGLVTNQPGLITNHQDSTNHQDL